MARNRIYVHNIAKYFRSTVSKFTHIMLQKLSPAPWPGCGDVCYLFKVPMSIGVIFKIRWHLFGTFSPCRWYIIKRIKVFRSDQPDILAKTTTLHVQHRPVGHSPGWNVSQSLCNKLSNTMQTMNWFGHLEYDTDALRCNEYFGSAYNRSLHRSLGVWRFTWPDPRVSGVQKAFAMRHGLLYESLPVL